VETSVLTLPAFDTGQYLGSEFLMAEGNAVLTIHVAELPTVIVRFNKVRWHEFTALGNCTAGQVEGAFFRVAEIVGSSSLLQYIANDRTLPKTYRELHHYRIFLDETGCHEVYAESCAL
jgi:hypothetical protein